MTRPERELIDAKFEGLKALIISQQDIQKVTDDNHLAIITEVRDLARITNGRVTKLEIQQSKHYTDCPNSEKINEINKSLLEYNIFIKYPKFFMACFVMFFLLSVYQIIAK